MTEISNKAIDYKRFVILQLNLKSFNEQQHHDSYPVMSSISLYLVVDRCPNEAKRSFELKRFGINWPDVDMADNIVRGRINWQRKLKVNAYFSLNFMPALDKRQEKIFIFSCSRSFKRNALSEEANSAGWLTFWEQDPDKHFTFNWGVDKCKFCILFNGLHWLL